jgi:hypothetical protein
MCCWEYYQSLAQIYYPAGNSPSAETAPRAVLDLPARVCANARMCHYPRSKRIMWAMCRGRMGYQRITEEGK